VINLAWWAHVPPRAGMEKRVLQRLRDWLEKRRRFHHALVFNRVCTHRRIAPCWMCPTCHSIHDAIATNKFTGLQYPACCTFAAGHRLDKEHATGIS
jgi:hypothetical protein